MATLGTTKAGSKQDSLVILGSNGNLGKALLANKNKFFEKFSCIYCFDVRHEDSLSIDNDSLKFIVADVVQTQYLSDLNLDPSLHRLTFLNLVAQDYPVTSAGLGENFSSILLKIRSSTYLLLQDPHIIF